jgi:hypothetical protein
MKIIKLVALGILILVGAGGSYADGLKINVTPMRTNQSSAELTIENGNNYPRIIRINVSNDNNRADVLVSALITAPANGKVTQIINAAEGKIFAGNVYWSYGQGVGDLTKKAEINGYQIPFDSQTKSTVCQYPHGKDPAIDFCAPIGTKVYAAKDGVVIWVVDQYAEGGNDPKYSNKANLVEVIHADGTKALYTHLENKSITVKAGAHIAKGEVLGAIGLSGQTSGPHLHFHVVKLNDELKDEFIDPVFEDENGKVIEIKKDFVVSRNESIPPQKATEKNIIERDVAVRAAKYPRPGSVGCEKIDGDAIKKANECLIKGNPQATIDILVKYTEKEKRNGRAYGLMGIAYSRLENHKMCVNSMRSAINIGWGTWDVFAHLGISLNAIGSIEESMKWNKNALMVAPTLVDVRTLLADQLLLKGRRVEALELLESFDKKRIKENKSPYFTAKIIAIKEGQ